VPTIDTHQHLFPDDYVTMLNENPTAHMTGGLAAAPAWSAAAAIQMMDRFGIATGILSNPLPSFGAERDAKYWARSVNEVGAATVEGQPDRFGYFAMVPLPDVDAAIEEVTYAFDTLHVDGVVLIANTEGIYLGDSRFDPLMRELNARQAVVFVHPTNLPGPAVPGIPEFAADFLLDTTRAAVQLVMSGTLERYPDLRVILSHAGGFLPYIAYRILPMLSRGDFGKLDHTLASLRRFYFDLALSSSPTALPSLLAFADPTHITFGTDWPAAPDDVVAFFGDQFTTYPFTDAQRTAIARGNAELLFPRLASRSVTTP
jgi:predicted TIM-barrel fold metal-dependent hydrolase